MAVEAELVEGRGFPQREHVIGQELAEEAEVPGALGILAAEIRKVVFDI